MNLVTATFTPFGTGCPGQPGIPTLTNEAGSLPYLCENFTVRMDNMRNGPFYVGIMTIGTSNTAWGAIPLPVPLAFLGMPGCDLRTDPLMMLFLGNQGGFCRLPLPVPGVPTLVGGSLYFQGLVYDPAANAMGLASTAGAQATIGMR